jgi:phosphatidylserine decarboxylase
MISYKKGKFNMAFNKNSINENESNEIVYETENGKIIKITQIAGYIARRIFCDIKKDNLVKQGDLYGLISFGSGCLIDIPSEYQLKIKKNLKVKAGLTVIASIKKNDGNK